MMGTEIFKIDACWAEELTKTRVSFLMTPTVFGIQTQLCLFSSHVLSECVMALGAGYTLLASPGSRSQWPELWMACTPVSVLGSGGNIL